MPFGHRWQDAGALVSRSWSGHVLTLSVLQKLASWCNIVSGAKIVDEHARHPSPMTWKSELHRGERTHLLQFIITSSGHCRVETLL